MVWRKEAGMRRKKAGIFLLALFCLILPIKEAGAGGRQEGDSMGRRFTGRYIDFGRAGVCWNCAEGQGSV